MLVARATPPVEPSAAQAAADVSWDGLDTPVNGPIIAIPAGPTLHLEADLPDILTFVDAYAEQLAKQTPVRDIKLGTINHTRSPRWMDSITVGCTTRVVHHPTTELAAQPWAVDDATTRALLHTIDDIAWLPDAISIEVEGLSLDMTGPRLTDSLRGLITAVNTISIDTGEKPDRARAVRIVGPGEIRASFSQPDTAGLPLAQQLLHTHTETLIYGSIRGQGHLTPAALIDEAEYRKWSRYWDRIVPDAYAVQVLTTTHVAHAHDLSRWDVTKLDDGHFLVQARNLDDWFTRGQLSLDNLTRAREDFAGIIATYDLLRTLPTPIWSEHLSVREANFREKQERIRAINGGAP